MTVDFSEHFWGEKQNGFNVLFQNSKNGQTSIKELSEFLKERAFIEDEYQKHLAKLTNKVANNGSVGTFGPVWQIIKNSLEKLSQLHLNFVQKLQDLHKEINKYNDEHQKLQKALKETENKTSEAVNLMQTTTTCLQKSKETYTARCLEHEKLKRENAQSKELIKSENKVKKAGEEYKQYVEKYAKVRDNFEQRMIASSKNFQIFEENHSQQMKQLLVNYAQNVENSQLVLHQAAMEFLDNVLNINVEDLLRDFVEKKATGTEKPSFYVFEEPDLSTLSPSNVSVPTVEVNTPDNTMSSGSSGHLLDSGGSKNTSTVPSIPEKMTSSSSLFSHLLDLSSLTGGATGGGGGQNTSLPAGQTTAGTPGSEVNGPVAAAPKKMSLWLPGRKSKNGLKSATPTSSPSDDLIGPSQPQQTSESGVAYLRKKAKESLGGKKRKESVMDNKSELSSEDAKSQMSEDKNVTVDEEGFSIKPSISTDFAKMNGDSSSDDDSDDGYPKKLTFQIKKPNERSISASVDELKDAVKEINMSNLTLKSSSRHRLSSYEKNLDEFDPVRYDPWSTNNENASSACHQYSTPMAEYLRPAKTGDDRFNTKLFAGFHWANDSQQGSLKAGGVRGGSAGKGTRLGSAPDDQGRFDAQFHTSYNNNTGQSNTSGDWPGESADRLGELVKPPEVPGPTVARLRPRSTTPTQQGQQTTDKFFPRSVSGGSVMDWSSNSNARHGSEPSAVPSPLAQMPLAVALTETVHVLFKDSGSFGSAVKIYGSLTMSFPSAVVQTLCKSSTDAGSSPFSTPPAAPQLIVKFLNSEKINAIVPNCQVLPNQSSFKTDQTHEFAFSMPALVEYLKRRQLASPSCPFYNVDVLRYEVKPEPSGRSVPLTLQSFWKCLPNQTDIVVQYNSNNDCKFLSSSSSPLLNLQFSTEVTGGEVTQAQLKPEGSWNKENNRLTWKVGEFSIRDNSADNSGSLKARLTLANTSTGNPSMSTPGPTSCQFQINDLLVSGSDVALLGTGYRLSLLKKKTVSGRYLCEPEIR